MTDVVALKQREKKLLVHRVHLLRQQKTLSYRPHEKQKLFHAVGAGHRERLFLAGNRCGKTLCGSFEMAYHLTGEYPAWWVGKRFCAPINAWAASVSVETTRDILQKLYIGDLGSGCAGVLAPQSIVKKTMRRGVSQAVDTVWVRHASGGISTLGFKSFDQGREKFQGTARHLIHLDEEPSLEIYEECLMRTATVKGHIMLTMTPLLGLTPLCEHFMAEKEDNPHVAVINAGWDDAPHLDEAEKKRLRARVSPHELSARELGQPTLGSGRVFPVLEEDIMVSRFDIPPHFKQVFGLDFGWTNPTAAVWLAHDVDADIVYITRTYTRTQATPQEHALHIKQRGHWIPGVCDPAGQSVGQVDGQSLMESYASHGLYLTRADNSVENGLMHMLERMQNGRLKVFSDLDEWWQEFRVYRRGKNGRIIKKNDHLMDATRYALMSGLTIASARIVAPSLPRRKADWQTV